MQETAPNTFDLHGNFEEEEFVNYPGFVDDDEDYEEDENEFVRASDFEEEGFEEEPRPDLRAEMQQAIDSGSSIASEYQATFTEAERISTVLNLRSDSFTITHGTVSMRELSPTLPLKESRKQTFKGLTQSVKELGILTPIHVM